MIQGTQEPTVAPRDELRRPARARRLALLFAARDAEHNNAVVLRDVLRR